MDASDLTTFSSTTDTQNFTLWAVGGPHESPEFYLADLLFLVLLALSITFNFLNILVFTNDQIAFPISSRIATCVFSLADIIADIANVFSVSWVVTQIGSSICIPILLITSSSLGMSTMALLFLNFDRCIAILFPFRHQRWFTKKFCIAANVFLWLTCIIMSAVAAVRDAYFYHPNLRRCVVLVTPLRELLGAMFSFFLPLGLMIVIYMQMILFIRKKIRAEQRVLPLRRLHSSEIAINQVEQPMRHDIGYNSRKMYKVLLTFFIVTLGFSFSWIPIRVMRFTILLHGRDFVPFTLGVTTQGFIICGTCWYFLIFSVMNAEFRRILRKMFKGCLPCF